MKNGKKLTLIEKKAIRRLGLDSSQWLRIKRTPYDILIVNSNTGETMEVRY